MKTTKIITGLIVFYALVMVSCKEEYIEECIDPIDTFPAGIYNADRIVKEIRVIDYYGSPAFSGFVLSDSTLTSPFNINIDKQNNLIILNQDSLELDFDIYQVQSSAEFYENGDRFNEFYFYESGCFYPDIYKEIYGYSDEDVACFNYTECGGFLTYGRSSDGTYAESRALMWPFITNDEITSTRHIRVSGSILDQEYPQTIDIDGTEISFDGDSMAYYITTHYIFDL